MRTIGPFLVGVALATPLAGCGKPPDAIVEDTPVKMISETDGVGPPAKADDLVTIDYRILLDDGRELLSEHGYRFIIGTDSVIEGIDDAVRGMRVTGERVVRCPPHRHWGRGGYGANDVPPNATLTIYLKLQAID
jgi:FKBP-type peptidyl-prolyl cis-trans isomerase